jgi:hypothetical protein
MQIIALLGVLALAVYWWVGGWRGIDKLLDPSESSPPTRYEQAGAAGAAPDAARTNGQQLGDVTGTSGCGSAARDYAVPRDSPLGGLSYTCCTIEGGSVCYRKVR